MSRVRVTRLSSRLLLAIAVVGALVGALAHPTPAFAQTNWGLAVLPSGALVFCDPVRSTVWRIEPDGTRTAALSGVTCHAVVTGPDGAVYGENLPGDLTERDALSPGTASAPGRNARPSSRAMSSTGSPPLPAARVARATGAPNSPPSTTLRASRSRETAPS